MIRKIKKWQIVLFSLILIIIIFFLYNLINFYSANKKMTLVETSKIYDNLFIVKNKISNFYIYNDGESIFCIDAGDILEITIEELKKINIDPESVQYVLLTHTDYDHTQGLSLFKNAEVYLSNEEEQMINGKTARFFLFFKNKLNVKYNLIKDNQEITIGKVKVKGILNPGHTPGSMSFIINNEILLAGDTLAIQNNRLVPFFKIFNMNTKNEIKSIKEKLFQLNNIKILCTGHTGYSYNWEDLKKSFKD